MEKYKFTSLAIFIIFFGTALFNAFQKQNWIEAALFLALGILSLWLILKGNKDENQQYIQTHHRYRSLRAGRYHWLGLYDSVLRIPLARYPRHNDCLCKNF